MYNNTTGATNVAIGQDALAGNTTASNNVAVGVSCLSSATTASYNTGVGKSALTVNTGESNVALGYQTLQANTSSNFNTAVGTDALFSNTGGYNTSVGGYALRDNTGGINNVAIGYNAGRNTVTNTTGDNNTFLGTHTHGPDSDAEYCIAIGYNVGGSNSTLTFGYSTTDTRCTAGATSWSNPSDERLKKDITTSTAGLSFINDLRPVTFKFKNEGDVPSDIGGYVEDSTVPFNNSLTNHGFIAQEVKTAMDSHTELKDGFDMWSEDGDGRQRIAPTALVPMLVKAIQELSTENEALVTRIEALENNA